MSTSPTLTSSLRLRSYPFTSTDLGETMGVVQGFDGHGTFRLVLRAG